MNKFLNLTTEEEWSCLSPHINTDRNFKIMSDLLVKRTYKDLIKKFLGRKDFKKRT